MKAFMFQAALICEECATRERAGLNPCMVDREDSDAYPIGPYDNGGGEADAPQHCDQCKKFLENPLTREGYAYASLTVYEYERYGTGNFNVLSEWIDFYSIPYRGNKRS